MKSTLISLVHLPLLVCACLLGGCADESGAIWYDDGERACYAEGKDGEPVEVPCPDAASPPSEALSDDCPLGDCGGCSVPKSCDPIGPAEPPPPPPPGDYEPSSDPPEP